MRRAADANTRAGVNLYFRAATVLVSDQNRATRDTDVAQIPGAWADCDDAEAAERAWTYDRFPPAACIVTGRVPALRGQFWWRFPEPIVAPEWSRQINRQIHAAFGGDPAVVNPSRMMRLPGSISWPYKPGRVPELVEWADETPGPSCTLDAARRAFPEVPDEAPAPSVNGHDISTAELLNPVRALLDQVKNGPKWHDALLRLVAHLVCRGTPDAVIMALAPELTWPGYTTEQTRVIAFQS